jgi:hypothetical protein
MMKCTMILALLIGSMFAVGCAPPDLSTQAAARLEAIEAVRPCFVHVE